MKKSEMQKSIVGRLKFYIKQMEFYKDDDFAVNEYLNKALALIGTIGEWGIDMDDITKTVIHARYGMLEETKTFTVYGEQIVIKGRK